MARPDTPPVVLLGPTMGPAVRASVARLQECVADPDPKVAVRAAAELTKLLAVCARLHIQLDADEPPPVAPARVSSPAAPSNVPPAAPPPDLRLTDLGPPAKHVHEVFAGVALPPNLRPPARVPGSPPALTSFLGKSAASRPSPDG